MEGRIAIVTGASSGIGAAIVAELVEAGVKVAGLARRVDKVKALAEKLAGQRGSVHPIQCDVSKENEVKKAFTWVETNLGAPHFVINNAGVLRQSMLEGMPIEEMKIIFDTNVFGLTLCAKEAVALMRKHKIEGTIINMNSIAGHIVCPFPGIAHYMASKHAVTALTEALRNELSVTKSNIRVSSISPGLVESEMSDQFKDHFTLETPILKASDIAYCVLCLLKAPQRLNISELTVGHVNESLAAFCQTTASMLAKKM